jgi:DNA-binding transcriptional LysR family regulator
MRYGNLKNADLNLLTSLQALVEERNITRAARRMFVSQPAMSRIVDRLQTMFGDQLLVRTSDGYEPTQRALTICAELQDLLPKMDALFQQSVFDPAKATGVFRIESTDWGATVLVPGLIATLAKHAPHMEIHVAPRQRGFDRLAIYDVDLVVTANLNGETVNTEGSSFRAAPLAEERWVCMMRKGHPLAKGRLTMKRYLSALHVSLDPMPSGRQEPSQEPHRMSLERLLHLSASRNVQARVPYVASLAPIVEHTDLIATAPMRLARRLATPKTVIVPAPREVPPLLYFQAWHVRNDSVPLHQWLRETLRKVAADLS